MNEVFTQTYAKEAIIETLADSALDAVRDPATVGNIGGLFNAAIADKAIQQEAKASLVHRNLFNLVTLNIPSTFANFSSKTMDLIQ